MSKTFPNLDAVLGRFKMLPSYMKDELREGQTQEGEEIITKSKDRTPVDTGNLRASEHQTTKVEGNKVITELIAGGPSAPYAVTVHEDLEMHHTVGQAKFLESALLEQINSGMDKRLATRVSNASRKAGFK